MNLIGLARRWSMSSQLFWTGRRVAIMGPTGFKGTWLAHWLVELEAEVTGIALTPPIEPSLFDASGLRRRIDSRIGDVRSRELLARHLNEASPRSCSILPRNRWCWQAWPIPSAPLKPTFWAS